ncbi:MAG: putative Ig domain-containing protein [Nitrospirae bacterium]|nr:putative Ig domain-containing protein [Nitrospirota bacterium]
MNKNIVVLLAFAVLFAACTSEKPAVTGTSASGQAVIQPLSGPAAGPGGGGASYALILRPDTARANTTLSLEAQGFNPGNAKIEWFINSTLPYTGENAPTLKGGIAKKGDTVHARATIADKEVISNTIKISNTPPVIGRIKRVPRLFNPTEPFGVEAMGTDTDGDEVTFIYEWRKNGEMAGTGSRFDGPVKKGDRVSVKITPFDGEEYGRPAFMTNDIVNMPPMIIDDKDFKFDGSVLTHKIKAVDPDGDPITYSLKNPPAGMSIDASSGLVTWTVPETYREKGSYTAVATDPNGGESFQLFNFDMSR